jgi:hypothetical protein
MPLRLYYAYGIRNSFGLDFDPITGSLWDTENGPHEGDEINLVNPGFNSGWQEIVGFSSSQKKFAVPKLVTFDGKGKYEEPKLVWAHSTGLTSLIFLDSEKLGTQYSNDMFVGDVHNGRIYHFKLNDETILYPKALVGNLLKSDQFWCRRYTIWCWIRRCAILLSDRQLSVLYPWNSKMFKFCKVSS